jgi:hypothetical protein
MFIAVDPLKHGRSVCLRAIFSSRTSTNFSCRQHINRYVSIHQIKGHNSFLDKMFQHQWNQFDRRCVGFSLYIYNFIPDHRVCDVPFKFGLRVFCLLLFRAYILYLDPVDKFSLDFWLARHEDTGAGQLLLVVTKSARKQTSPRALICWL